jgi:hypothetical protein
MVPDQQDDFGQVTSVLSTQSHTHTHVCMQPTLYPCSPVPHVSEWGVSGWELWSSFAATVSVAHSEPPSWLDVSPSLMHRQLPLGNDLKGSQKQPTLGNIPRPLPACHGAFVRPG